MTYYLRAASSDRMDFFKGNLVRKPDGSIEITGGNVREPYLPHEVWIVPKAALDEVRGIAREVEQHLASTTVSDVARARERDDASMELTARLRDLSSRMAQSGTPFELAGPVPQWATQ